MTCFSAASWAVTDPYLSYTAITSFLVLSPCYNGLHGQQHQAGCAINAGDVTPLRTRREMDPRTLP